jgi:hypothetical protein
VIGVYELGLMEFMWLLMLTWCEPLLALAFMFKFKFMLTLLILYAELGVE